MEVKCGSIKAALSEYVCSLLDVRQLEDTCVVTLPLETIDGRLVGVFIEPRAADFFLIHDGGKAVDELVLQGMKLTPAVERGLSAVAQRFGVSYDDEAFQAGTKIANLASRAYAVGMSSATAMATLLDHVSIVEEEPIEGQIGTMLKQWGKNRAKITQNVRLIGELKQHTFDFLVSPRRRGKPIAVSVLNPSNNPLAAAERFYFKANDLSPTAFGKWPIVAIETKSEIWSPDARRIVQKYAAGVIPIRSNEKPDYHRLSDALETVA